MPRARLAYLAALGLFVAALGLIWGARSGGPSDADLIARAAERYMRETGGGATDCAARPVSAQGLRLMVVCAPAQGEGAVYLIDRWGRFLSHPEVAAGYDRGDRT